ncbi:MAG: putative colanic acid biosynthesis acetyltransferase [Methylotenera sp.]|nr:putative colanic acid biosynthesis acetyltransferase [Methylotenera sp.]
MKFKSHIIDHDPYATPAFGLKSKVARFAWGVCYIIFFRPSPRPFFAWRRFLLGIFGAKLGKDVAIYPTARVWAPWNLVCADMVAIANGAELYNPSVIYLGSHAIISQDAFLCGASHDYNDIRFPLFSKSIHVGAYAWVCARACVMPGVTIEDGAVLGLSAVATADLNAWTVYAGSPAKAVKLRKNNFKVA